MNNINYSIIIPHKNIPNLLQRCLNSIPRRKDVQIIVVDDNSEPGTVDFNDFPGFGESCVEVYFTKEGKGAGYARNVGLKYAVGRWLLFADADDYFVDGLFGYLDDYLDDDFVDVVFFNADCVDSDTQESYKLPYFGNQLNKIITSKTKDAEWDLRYSFGPPWCKLMKKRLLDEYTITFDETPRHNDTMFSVKIGYYAKMVIIDKRIIYHNTFRVGSISNSKNKEATVPILMGIFIRYDNFIEASGIRNRSFKVYYALEFYLKTDMDSFLIAIRYLFLIKYNFFKKSFFYVFTRFCSIIHIANILLRVEKIE